jgi:hypothetical protein
MMHRQIIAISLLVSLFCIQNIFGQESSQNKKDWKKPKIVLNPDGWVVPGIKNIAKGASPENSHIETVEGQKVNVSTLNPVHPLSDHPGVFVPLIGIKEDTVRCLLQELVGEKITQYQLDGKIFCYLVYATYWAYDDETKMGVRVAAATWFAYYDEDGNGKFETLEYAYYVLGSPEMWKVHLPRWKTNPALPPNR